MTEAESKPRLQAVMVIYNVPLAESATFGSLEPLLAAESSLAAGLDLLVADNSRTPQPVPDGVAYLHDGSNPGLAARYNAALARAVGTGATWLLLLDDDTTLTPAWFAELDELSVSLADRPEVVAIVPRLVTPLPDGDRTESPHLPSFLPPSMSLDRDSYGVLEGLVRVYNSGALVRVSALEAIGGFPKAYPLDYLDHATFHRLQAAGGKVYLMRAALAHDMSIFRTDRHRSAAHAGRHRGRLDTERRFYREYGTPAERRLHRLHLLRSALEAALHGHPGDAARCMRAALVYSLARA